MKRLGRVGAVLAASAIAACFAKPGAPHAGDGGTTTDDGRKDGNTGLDASMGDAPGDSQANNNCGTQDDFNNSSVLNCQPWGDPVTSTNATITRPSGTLDFNFSGGVAESASCTTKVPFNITNGTSIHIVQPSNNQTSFALTLNGKITTFMLTYNGSMYSSLLICPDTSSNLAEMSSVPPAWIQMKVTVPGGGGLRVTLERSPSGNVGTWVEFQSCTFTAASTSVGTVTLAGSGSGTTAAKFDDFNIKNCPPL